jgi:hypothetical protein
MKWTRKGLHEEGMFKGFEYEEGGGGGTVQGIVSGEEVVDEEGGEDGVCSAGAEKKGSLDEGGGKKKGKEKEEEDEEEEEEEEEEERAAGAWFVQDLDEGRRIVRDASVLVGLHPDQAAESIVRFAMLSNKVRSRVKVFLVQGFDKADG